MTSSTSITALPSGKSTFTEDEPIVDAAASTMASTMAALVAAGAFRARGASTTRRRSSGFVLMFLL
jgi:hypothetical protein